MLRSYTYSLEVEGGGGRGQEKRERKVYKDGSSTHSFHLSSSLWLLDGRMNRGGKKKRKTQTHLEIMSLEGEGGRKREKKEGGEGEKSCGEGKEKAVYHRQTGGQQTGLDCSKELD